MFSNLLALLGFVSLVTAAALVAPAAGFAVAGASCVYVSRQVAR